ncbi:membrane-associated protein, putative [Bodo saltans]|uniref:Membrane-associated protein, putative n=1 Tax=Bodo saltans TaxID=75058 RepID=A0A0S4IV04_BODSA|nr:membrane-associated protein, putative [Bodo saltans]|eukprot:CUF46577.1 membrane-associated protein, putative [Bodo saltans]
MTPSKRLLSPTSALLALLFALSSLAAPVAALVTVTICNTSTCDPASCDAPQTEKQNTCFNIPNEPLPNSMFICGDTYVVQTAFPRPDCGIYSTRTSRVFRSNSCVPMQNNPLRYIFVTCDTSVAMTRTASNGPDCGGETTSSGVALGSCNNLVGFSGVEFSIIPTCEHGLAFVRYFSGNNCTGNHVSTFHDSGSCDNSFMGDPVTVQYDCPIETLERVCLNIQHPGFVLAGVGLAVAIVMILPMMYCCVFCCARCDCCELDVTETPSHENDYYIGMETLKRDVVQLMRRGDDANKCVQMAQVNGQGNAAPLTGAPQRAPTVKFSTISGFSSDTVRGTQYLFASTTAASITFCLLAGMNQTIQTTDRPDWMFCLMFASYASIIVTGLVPTPNIAHKRHFHISCCWSFSEHSCFAEWVHVGSALIFLVCPSVLTLWLQFGVLSDIDIEYEGQTRHWVLIVGAVLTLVFSVSFFVSTCFRGAHPTVSFGLEALAYCLALITAVVTEIWSLVVCITPDLG